MLAYFQEDCQGPGFTWQWEPENGASRMDWELSPDGRNLLRPAWEIPAEDRLNTEALVAREAKLWTEMGWAPDEKKAAFIIREILRARWRLTDIRKLLAQGYSFGEISKWVLEARAVEIEPDAAEIQASFFTESSALEVLDGEVPDSGEETFSGDWYDALTQAKARLVKQRVFETLAEIARVNRKYNAHRDWAVYPVAAKPEEDLLDLVRWVLIKAVSNNPGDEETALECLAEVLGKSADLVKALSWTRRVAQAVVEAEHTKDIEEVRNIKTQILKSISKDINRLSGRKARYAKLVYIAARDRFEMREKQLEEENGAPKTENQKTKPHG